MNQRNVILDKIEIIPPLPVSVIEVMKIVEDPDHDVNELINTIEYDPGLTANVLRLANSSYYGGTHRIGSLRQAIVRLGGSQLSQLVLVSLVAPIAKPEIKGYDMPSGELWLHSVTAAMGVKILAKELSLDINDTIFTAALLHDLGKIVLGTFIEIDSAPIMKLAFEENLSFEIAEQEVLGIDHAEVGSILLNRWDFPQDIIETVRWHHEPEQVTKNSVMVDLVHIADQIIVTSGIGGIGKDGLNYRCSKISADRLNISTTIIETVLCKVVENLDELKESLGINPGR